MSKSEIKNKDLDPNAPLVSYENILVEEDRPEKGEEKKTYYIPGFFRIKVKNFTEMSLQNLSAQMNATLIFTIYYGDLHKDIVSELQNGFILLFGRDDALKLTEQDSLQTKVSHKPEKHQMTFTVRKIFNLRVYTGRWDIWFTPFEIINLILSITIQPVQTKQGTVKVNLLDFGNYFSQGKQYLKNFTKHSYTEEGTFGNYDLAEMKMRVAYSNDRVCQIQNMKLTDKQKFQKAEEQQAQKTLEGSKKKKKIQQFQYAHFNIPLYKYPLVALATIFLPLWLLAIINLGIFFQNETLADRIASIAALMIAFVALIPTIRQQIPPSPYIVFIEILVYLQTLTSLFALIHSLDVRNIKDYNIQWREDGLFIISLIISILTCLPILVLMVLHYGFWQRSYNPNYEDKTEEKLEKNLWYNKRCDHYFKEMKKFFQEKAQTKKTITILPPPLLSKKQKPKKETQDLLKKLKDN